MFSIQLVPSVVEAAKSPLESACSKLSAEQKATSTACEKIAEDDEGNAINPISGGTNSILYKITILVSAIAGAIAVIIIIVGGISMITAGGDSQKFGNARNTIIFAVVGLIIIVLAQALITFVITRFG